MMACGLPYPRIEQGPLSPRCRIMSTERQHRRDIVSFGRALHERGFAAAGLALNQPLVCEVVIGLGSIPLAKYGTPGTPELTDALEPLVPQYDAILMSNHGVVAYGSDLNHAYMKMETVEHFAQIALVTHLLGRQQPLGSEELEKLLLARSKYQGSTSAAPLPLAVQDEGNHRNREEAAADSASFEDGKPRRLVSRHR